MILLPKPKIQQRTVCNLRYQAAITKGLDPVIAKIIAARPYIDSHCPAKMFDPKLKFLNSPDQLQDIEHASSRIVKAIINKETIGLETDHDCDGQTSHAVLYYALKDCFKHPKEKIRSYIGHRLEEGYGLSEALAKRILADQICPSLIITADNGSADEPRIKLLKEQNIDTIVTDHHEIPLDGIPKSAYAVINPTREDCDYPDRYIAGCMVAWLLMAKVRAKLIHENYLPKDSEHLSCLLDFVAVGTIADCVSIARSLNNRAVVKYGIKLISKGLRPCWRALLPFLPSPIKSEDLGFNIGPLLNSDGRLDSALGSVSFLLSETNDAAEAWVKHLMTQNQNRKDIQKKLVSMAMNKATQAWQSGKNSLVMYLEDGHAGVHGIAASRIKDAFGRPTIIFSPKLGEPDVITGSGRSIDGLHLLKILQKVAQRIPDKIVKYGGHSGACGLTIQKNCLTEFIELFEQATIEQLNNCSAYIGPVIFTDGQMLASWLNPEYLEAMLDSLEPFGREFEAPVFSAQAKLLSYNIIGKTKEHAKLNLKLDNDANISAVWFNCAKQGVLNIDLIQGDLVSVVIAPKTQYFRNQLQLNCQVIDLQVN